MNKIQPKLFVIALLFFALLIFAFAQTAAAQTTAFTYQGRLSDSANSGNGSYLMRFELYADAAGNTLIDTLTDVPVSVTNNIFTVQLNFAASNAFDGGNRFLKISVKRNASETYTPLNPLQPVTSTPYAIRSLNATTADLATNASKLGDTNADQFVRTNDSRLSDARSPIAGSINYIQNTTTQQAGASFNISGNGTIGGALTSNTVNASSASNFVFNGQSSSAIGAWLKLKNTSTGGRDWNIISTGSGNSEGAGKLLFNDQTDGGSTRMQLDGIGLNVNGTSAANVFNATQQYNLGGSRVLSAAGTRNFFAGINAGISNTGTFNLFIGSGAGQNNTSGEVNSFVGAQAGASNTTGGYNSFFGSAAGLSNIGSYNSFVGATAGYNNVGGSNNSFVGYNAGFQNTTGSGNTFVGYNAGLTNRTGGNITLIGSNSSNADNLNYATAVGAGAVVGTSNTIVLGRGDGSDLVRVYGLGASGVTQLCRNANAEISNCSSSLRYKTNIAPFTSGLDLIKRLRPISYEWKEGGMKDVGFGAEDVAKIHPQLVIYDKNGQVEGVKYDRFSVLFVNAFKEQQAQIESQQKQIDELKQIVCAIKPDAAVCKAEEK